MTGKHRKKHSAAPGLLRSGELAKRAGVSPDTLRFYERKGLLPEPVRTPSGYRMYSENAFVRVRMIRSALAVGFTIRELADVFGIRDAGGAPCEEVLSLAKKKVAELEERIAQLASARRDLQSCIRKWNKMLLQVRKGTRAGLLERMQIVNGTSPMSPPGLNKNRRINHE